jgi:CheY-like chemotaxis protein
MPNHESPARVLIVEDDVAAQEVFADMLEELGAVVATASSVSEARAKLGSFAPTLVITDFYMPGETGMAMRAEVQAWNAAVPVVALTGADDAKVPPGAGFTRIVRKPVTLQALGELLTLARPDHAPPR